MAITWYGFDNADLTESGQAQLARRQGMMGYHHGLPLPPTHTYSTSTRSVTISSFGALFPAIYADSNASETRVHDTQATGTRVDYGVLTANWSTNTVILEVVKGTSTAGVAPSLTQNAGVLWQMPVWRSTITSTSFISEICWPQTRTEKVVHVSVNTAVTASTSGEWRDIGAITLSDPGWPWTMQVMAQVRFLRNPVGGVGLLRIVEGTNVIAEGVSPQLHLGGNQFLNIVGNTSSVTGKRILYLQMSSFNMTSGTLSLLPGYASFSVRKVPA